MIQDQLRFPFHATTGFSFLWHSSARMLSFALHRWSQTGPRLAPYWPQTGPSCLTAAPQLPHSCPTAAPQLPHSCPTVVPQLPHSCPTVVPNMSPNSAPNCFQTVSRLCLNCAQTVPRHAVARAIARVTGEAYRLTRLTRLSLHVVRFPQTRRHSLACF